jgi:ATP-dependent RNA helicase SUPV3L1/SUV3
MKKSKIDLEIEAKIKNQIYGKWFSKNTRYVLHIGPTNSGKTFSAVQALKNSNRGIYLAPLRLLAWEIQDRLTKEGYLCSLLTGEEKIIIPQANLTSCTIEMCNFQKHYDVAIVDECFMIADRQRGKFWLDAIMKLNCDEVHVISNPESLPLLRKLLELTDNVYEINEYERKTPLEISDKEVNLKKLLPKTILVTFSRINVLYYKYLLQQFGKKAAILYGNLPPEVKREQIRSFVDGENSVLITTDVIGMGINLPCHQIVFLEDSKFDGESVRKLNEKEIKQISGRAGRFGLSEKGIVTALDPMFAFDSILEEKNGFYGLDGEIYKLIPETNPRQKLKYFEQRTWMPSDLSFLKMEDLEKYYILARQYDLALLEDDLAWAFLSCPVNEQNQNFWKFAVASAVHLNQINFNERYFIDEINNIKELELAENAIANIDLFFYMYNNRTLNPLFLKYNEDYLTILKSHKEIIIDNINNFLLLKKIKEKEIKKPAKK